MNLAFFLKTLFISVSVILIFVLILLTRFMYVKKNEYRKYIATPIVIGVFTIIAYIFFLLSKSHTSAVFFDSLFFVGTDWLAMFMMVFAIVYTQLTVKNLKRTVIVCSILCCVDSVSLLLNNFFFHMYDLVPMVAFETVEYWGNEFKFLHYVHLMLCYIMVGYTFVVFVISTIKVPAFYKEKYFSLFIAYIVVIGANFLCYSLNLPFDLSVILYAVLAGFICYYATYAFPSRLLNQTLSSINENISDAILYFDIEGNLVYANKAARNIFVGNDNNSFDVKAAEKYHKKFVAGGEITVTDHFDIKGRTLYYNIEFKLEFENGCEVGSYIKMDNITLEIERLNKEKDLAIHDPLTGALNRVGFIEAVDAYVAEHGTENYLMVCSNIKEFKLINKFFGDSVGDGVIKTQTELFRNNSSEGSLYGRIGDDKFALFLSVDRFSEERLMHYIRILQTSTEKSIYQLKVSAGIYNPEGRIESAQSMIDKTLLAMKQINDDYDKVFSYYDSTLMDKLLYEKTIVEDFATAIEKKQITMNLQPILDNDENWIGAEVLCRWNHPLRGFMKPEEFLSILENAGVVYKLDEFIWESAFQLLKSWNEKGYKKTYVSVNVSVKDFFYTDVYKIFTDFADRYDVNPQNVHIEVTETVLMSDFAKAYILAEKLQKFGFKVAIDNFGNGYSSLNMLKDYRVEILKIDRDFIKNAADDTRSQVILKTILNMAESLDMEVIGEGVEDSSQYQILKQNGCDFYQGNYFSEPLSIEEYEYRMFLN